ncbi:MAG: hypothetical protein M3304_07510 [Actinomycetota bacterium]|nr:hypothetical protein [Actinomycetota bacterium]
MSRARELWRHRETGEAWLVETEADRVVNASGPLTPDQLADEALAYKQAAQGRSPGFTEEAADLDRRRGEFDRERLEPPGERAAPPGALGS